jgi:peptide-methionine (S)-S-oxide reductase
MMVMNVSKQPLTLRLFEDLIHRFNEIIDPSINQQGNDIGEKYRTGIYSNNQNHLLKAKLY